MSNQPIRQQATSAFKEADLLPGHEPDFNLRPLQDYPSAEIDNLMKAVSFLRNIKHDGVRLSDQELRDLDIWCYRIRDARKIALHREEARQS